MSNLLLMSLHDGTTRYESCRIGHSHFHFAWNSLIGIHFHRINTQTSGRFWHEHFLCWMVQKFMNTLWFELPLLSSGTCEVQVEYLSPRSVISFTRGSWNLSRPAYLNTVCGHHAPSHSVEFRGTFLGPRSHHDLLPSHSLEVHRTFPGPQMSQRSAATTRHRIRRRSMEPF